MWHSFLCGCVLVGVTLPALAQSDELAAKAQRGMQAMAAERFAEAISIYSELVQALPENAGLIMNLGLAQHMAGQHRKAIQQFQAALKLDAKLLPAWLFLGVSRLKVGEPAQAIVPLQKVLELQPDHEQARQVLADALLSVGRFEPAAEHFRRLCDLGRDNARAWYGLGRSYESLSRRAFEDLERVAPHSGYWLALVAAARLTQQQYSSAFYFYRQALEKLPTLRGMHTALAAVYQRTGHPDWAAMEEEKERQLGAPDCSSRKVECDFFAGRHREVIASVRGKKTPESLYWQSQSYNELAAQAFSRLTQLPPSVELHELMAEIHRNQGRHRESAREWQEALKLSPGDARLQQELAISLHQSRDYQGAQSLLEDLLKREPNSAELNYFLGDAFLNLQQAEKAVPFLKKAVQRESTLLPAQASLARALLQVGEAAQAIPHLKAALPIDEDGSLHYQLSRAYQTGGQPELAKQTLQKYQEILKSARAQRQQLEQEVQITPP